MTTTATIRVTSSGVDLLAKQFGRTENRVARLGRTSGRTASLMSRHLSKVSGGVGRLYAAAGGVGLAAGAKKIFDFDDALGALQARSRMLPADAKAMRDGILATASATGVQKDQILAALNVGQDFGGYLQEMIGIQRQLAMAHKATGTDMADLATVAATMFKQGFTPKQVTDGLALLSKQADIADVALKDLSRVMPELMGLMAGKGFTGTRALTQIGAAMQIIGRGTAGKAEEARTQFNAMIRDIERNAKKLKGKKIDIYADAKTGKLKDINAIMGEIVSKVGSTEERKFFSDEGLKALAQFRLAFKGGKLDAKAAGLYKAQGTTFDSLKKQYEIAVGGIAAESEKVKRSLAELDEAFQKHGKRLINWAAENKGTAAAAAGGGLLALKFGPALLGRIGGLLRRKLGKKGDAGDLTDAAGVQKVYVVNMPGSGPGNVPEGTKGKGIGMLRHVAGAAAAYTMATKGGLSSGKYGMEALAAKGKQIERQKYADSIIKSALIGQARQLAGLGKQGVTSFGAAGAKKALTAENIMAHLQASAARQGGSAETFAAVAPLLKQILAALKNGPNVVVKPADGIDAVAVKQSRGVQ